MLRALGSIAAEDLSDDAEAYLLSFPTDRLEISLEGVMASIVLAERLISLHGIKESLEMYIELITTGADYNWPIHSAIVRTVSKDLDNAWEVFEILRSEIAQTQKGVAERLAQILRYAMDNIALCGDERQKQHLEREKSFLLFTLSNSKPGKILTQGEKDSPLRYEDPIVRAANMQMGRTL